MRALRSIAFGMLAALITGGLAFAVTSGGFPANPRFNSIGIQQSPLAYAWDPGTPHIQFNPTVAIATPTANGSIELVSNCYFDGTNWRYMTSAACTLYVVNASGQRIFSAAAGTAGAIAALVSTPMSPSFSGALGFATGSCSIVTGSNFTSCSHQAVGDNIYNFTAYGTNIPTCVASLRGSATASHVVTFNTTASSVEVIEFNSSGAAADLGPANTICTYGT